MCFSAANISTDMLPSLSKEDLRDLFPRPEHFFQRRTIWRTTHGENEVISDFNIAWMFNHAVIYSVSETVMVCVFSFPVDFPVLFFSSVSSFPYFLWSSFLFLATCLVVSIFWSNPAKPDGNNSFLVLLLLLHY